MVVESDKADMEVEAFDPGYLAAILVDEGGSAPVGKTVGLVAEKLEDIEKVKQCGLDCIDSGSSSRHDGTTALETVEFFDSKEDSDFEQRFSSNGSAEQNAMKLPEHVPILMPTLSSTMTEGKIVQWLKKEGDYVKSGEMIMVVESDKADMEVESFDEGYLAHVLYPNESSCPVGTTVAYLVSNAADIPQMKQWASESKNRSTAPTHKSTQEASPSVELSASTIPSTSLQGSSSRVIASPYARKIASEKNISLSGLKGSGEGGRIVAKDVLEASEKGASSNVNQEKPTLVMATPQAKKLAESFGISLDSISVGSGPYGRIIPADVYKAAGKGPPPPPPHLVDFQATKSSKNGDSSVAPGRVSKDNRSRSTETSSSMMPKGEVAMNSMQKAVVQNMNASLQVPVFRVTYTVNMDAVEALYKKLSEKGVSMSTILAKAAALTLRKHSVMNASYGKDSIIYRNDIHIAMAVALPDGGLITPVLKNADQEDIYTLSKSWRDLVKRALMKKLSPDEYSTGTFFISNLGMFGVTSFDAILPPGAGAILAVAASKPVVGMQPNGFIGVSKQMQMTITCDHRHIYGAQAASFLKDFSTLLEENPQELTL
ncbi:dihydrolipoamide acetyltransferase [Galdieria sulphuraria]|uniref:Dihydrolipoamide acetyltransferase component of pyruvate dehydrogenase complex n=1 Tax=Galdieria sulphuraria TaxID=130081 RepID=M2WYM2_GALSU|nr:dihydrolipoamide acetyltransferase [Galdieria sulphuraria]EME29150.1 dihydrolipoamide acetyltransferase [Galdieria sulphuraria]|eukprot:XP_005705670.1 dihydrolipoamide acetyltransferase [Galdieria sulphuraria]